MAEQLLPTARQLSFPEELKILRLGGLRSRISPSEVQKVLAGKEACLPGSGACPCKSRSGRHTSVRGPWILLAWLWCVCVWEGHCLAQSASPAPKVDTWWACVRTQSLSPILQHFESSQNKPPLPQCQGTCKQSLGCPGQLCFSAC